MWKHKALPGREGDQRDPPVGRALEGVSWLCSEVPSEGLLPPLLRCPSCDAVAPQGPTTEASRDSCSKRPGAMVTNKYTRFQEKSQLPKYQLPGPKSNPSNDARSFLPPLSLRASSICCIPFQHKPTHSGGSASQTQWGRGPRLGPEGLAAISPGDSQASLDSSPLCGASCEVPLRPGPPISREATLLSLFS